MAVPTPTPTLTLTTGAADLPVLRVIHILAELGMSAGHREKSSSKLSLSTSSSSSYTEPAGAPGSGRDTPHGTPAAALTVGWR